MSPATRALACALVAVLAACCRGQPNPVVLRNSYGMETHILRVGACVQRLLVPDAVTGELVDVMMGFEDPEQYRVSG